MDIYFCMFEYSLWCFRYLGFSFSLDRVEFFLSSPEILRQWFIHAFLHWFKTRDQSEFLLKLPDLFFFFNIPKQRSFAFYFFRFYFISLVIWCLKKRTIHFCSNRTKAFIICCKQSEAFSFKKNGLLYQLFFRFSWFFFICLLPSCDYVFLFSFYFSTTSFHLSTNTSTNSLWCFFSFSFYLFIYYFYFFFFFTFSKFSFCIESSISIFIFILYEAFSTNIIHFDLYLLLS